MTKLGNWLDQRIGYRRIRSKLLYEPILGGPRWHYIWGSTLVFTFLLQLFTGLLLWSSYSPSIRAAWESVYFIQYHMEMGWFIRGIHHYASHVMIVLLVCHLLQVLLAGAYRTPREVNWWLGLLLLGIVFGLSLTGYLLPWDERGYWATQVSTKIVGTIPIVGQTLERLLLGGPNYGHHTLTRFFALHAGLLPALFTLFLVIHVTLFRRHGVTPPKNAKGTTPFWPYQAVRDGFACIAVLVVLIFLAGWGDLDRGFVFGPEGGAPLQAPADPSSYSPSARPEWYLLFLYQFLKYFPGKSELFGAIVIPSLIAGLMILFPFLGRTRRGHSFCVGITLATLTGVLILTVTAILEDQKRPMYLEGLDQAKKRSQRIFKLAQEEGIPTDGALALLRRDPQSQGPILFRDNCSMCHRWDGHDGTGVQVLEIQDDQIIQSVPTASDLENFGKQEWVSQFLRNPNADRFFGLTAHRNGPMAQWSKKNIPLMTDTEIEAVAFFVTSQEQIPETQSTDKSLTTLGARLFASGSTSGAQACSNCHKLDHPDIPISGTELGPDLTSYGSPNWLKGIIRDSSQSNYYGPEKATMPEFSGRLQNQELHLLTEWMLGARE